MIWRLDPVARRTSRRSRRGARGFTLLEVLVALSILAVTLVALYQAFSTSLYILSANRGLWKAMLFADEELQRWERMYNPPLHVNQGTFEPDHPMYGYSWLREVSAESLIPNSNVRKVTLRLTWREGLREQSYESSIYVVSR